MATAREKNVLLGKLRIKRKIRAADGAKRRENDYMARQCRMLDGLQ